ncbi:type 4 prepilin peptidase 1 Aspartic peptidase. MEROPS family A24A [Nitrosospira multiformis]|uniref:Prepilin leader peptidase/N-methyltransferase n=1 Tax=Nitrosospira multiformis TaxID=1231 RepID=A0A1H9YKJ0_9PROT|nr:A24 family peptidase [Nitrosospira multiformis]SES69045.1 type 4 prepilin peptidase 1 Aspartic peptidase. MEROPS family A24A [Nitrosospira multiformis]
MSFISVLQYSPAFFVSFCALIGLIVGSFLNVVIYRLPRMLEREWRQQCAELHAELSSGTNGTEPAHEPHEALAAGPAFNLITPSSTCPNCGHRITALENIPLISYVALRGRCSQCRTAISIRYPVVEGLTAALSGLVAWHFGYGVIVFAALALVWAMIALAFIDLDTQLLPNDITMPLLWGGLLINLGGGFADIHSAVIGAVMGYLALWSVYWGYKLLTGREGMGYGDFKLLAAIGAWLGWQMLPLVILFSSLVGSMAGLGLMLAAKHGRHVPIPFGPYLVCGGIVALFWGNEINRAYLGSF